MKKIFFTCALLLSFCFCAHAEEKARFIFIGDIMAHQQQLDAARLGKSVYDFSPQFRRVKPLFENAFLVGNLETTFSGTGKKLNYSGYPLFNTPDILAETLSKDLGVNLLTLANNHIFDRGAAGARRTVEVLKSADIPFIGLGLDDVPSNDAVLLVNDGIRAAFINHSYGSNLLPKNSDVHLNTTDEASIKQSLERAKSLSPDVIIACFHWGYEYHYSPSSYQKDAANTAFQNGADLIIGTHPHVLQPIEVRDISGDFKAVAWSLGNFVSFQRTLPRERTCIFSAEFIKDDTGRTRLARIAAAPLQVIAPGQKRTWVTYAGTDEATIEKLDFDGLTKLQLTNLRRAGRAVLDFLGAQDKFDEYGFNILWDEDEPDILPAPRRKSPKD